MSRQDEVQKYLQRCALPGQPCLGCENSAGCADLELACRAFRAWVNGLDPAGRPREPSRRLFLQMSESD